MSKRKRESGIEHRLREPAAKRARASNKDYFLELSDELILRILSFLPLSELTKVERVSSRIRNLATDNEIWKERFYIRFVRPRARRIPALNTLSQNEREGQALHYASKSAKWLEHNATSGEATDWKRRYKIKLNWTKGRCKARELTLDCPYLPKILVKIHHGMIFTADEKKLRLYSQRARPQILSTHYWTGNKRPTAMAIGTQRETPTIVVGFSDGSLEVLEVQTDDTVIQVISYDFYSSSAVTCIAVAWPNVLMMSADHQMTLLEISLDDSSMGHPRVDILTSLRSDAPLSPVSLSIRRTTTTLVASIAYSFSRLNAGWCLGLQEIRIALSGTILSSRLTSTVETPMRDFPFRKGAVSSRSASTAPFALHPNLMNPPSSLSHSGCYILAGLPDNTLMVYTVVSDQDKLEISAGRRLFGHTSSVSGAEVSDRGRALSVSAKGDEIRVWELEDLLSSWSLQKSSTQLQPRYTTDDLSHALAKRGAGLGLALKEVKDELSWNRHWVGFDDEQVVVLGERDQRQILSCYDFA